MVYFGAAALETVLECAALSDEREAAQKMERYEARSEVLLISELQSGSMRG